MTHNAARPARKRDDEGFSLVELIAYMSILSLVLAIIGGILISTMTGERDIRTRAEATTAGQSVVASVQAGVRNAAFTQLVDLPNAQMLTVRTAGTGATLTWACEAWYFTTDNGGSLYQKRTNPATQIAQPTAATLSTWVLIANGISENGADIFTSVAAGEVSMQLLVSNGGEPIVMNSKAKMRVLSTTISPC